MKIRHDIESLVSAEYVSQILEYRPDTGEFFWRRRSVESFRGGKYSASRMCNAWNSRIAGKEAGCANKNGNVRIRILGRMFCAHRVAFLLMTGKWPANEVDHENLSRSDNRWVNLREATPSENGANKPSWRNRTGFKGVSKTSSGKYQAEVRAGGMRFYLGVYGTADEAGNAYAIEAKRIFGHFANFEVS